MWLWLGQVLETCSWLYIPLLSRILSQFIGMLSLLYTSYYRLVGTLAISLISEFWAKIPRSRSYPVWFSQSSSLTPWRLPLLWSADSVFLVHPWGSFVCFEFLFQIRYTNEGSYFACFKHSCFLWSPGQGFNSHFRMGGNIQPTTGSVELCNYRCLVICNFSEYKDMAVESPVVITQSGSTVDGPLVE